MVEYCYICKRELDVPDDPYSADCGGDCTECMALVVEDPDCIATIQQALRDKIVRKPRRYQPVA